jgi:hypothetical protein
MIQRYTALAGALSLLVVGRAQDATRALTPALGTPDEAVAIPAPSADPRGGGGNIFYDDFANGLDGNNGFGAWTVSGANGNIWHKKVGNPNGFYIGANPANARIQSATAANGYMIFNGDSANCTWSDNTPTALPVDQFTNWEGSLESPVLNLTATPNVRLTFQQRLRYCCGDPPQFVEVSTDGGISWPFSYPTAETVDANTLTPTQTISLDLSDAVSTGPSNVKFRFRHSSEAATSHYHWQIDDVTLSPVGSYERQMMTTIVSNVPLTQGYEHARIPAPQVSSLYLGCEMKNLGLSDQTNVTLSAAVAGPVNLNASQSFASVPYAQSVNMDQAVAASNLLDGQYNLTFSMTSDQDAEEANTADDVLTRRFQVDSLTYALDGIGVFDAPITTSVGSNSFTNNNSGLTMMTYYPLRTAMTVSGVEILLASGTTLGTTIRVALRDTAGVIPSGSGAVPTLPAASLLVESQPVDIAQADIDAGKIFVPFDAPYTVTVPANGRAIFACAKLTGTATAIVRIVDDTTVPQPAWGSCIHLAVAPSATNVARVYSNGNAFAIRLRKYTASGVGVNEVAALEGISLFPNPTTGQLTFRAAQAGNYTIEVFDALGSVALRTRSNGQSTLDLAGQPAGVYLVRVTSAQGSTVSRITLEH